MQLALASANQGKLKEMKALLEPLGLDIKTAAELGFTDEVPETGSTFLENAALKAEAVGQALGIPALADDSGLMVDALDGAPGVYSARYSGPDANAERNNAKLLAELKGVPQEKRGAAFVCVMYCHKPDGTSLVTRGELRGRIAFEVIGDGGFGFDPLFYIPEKGCTAAQLTPQEKNAISHRGQAIKKLMQDLEVFLGIKSPPASS